MEYLNSVLSLGGPMLPKTKQRNLTEEERRDGKELHDGKAVRDLTK
jgi:hypothetical protein